MLLGVVVTLFACTINVAVVAQSVAPGDEEPLCVPLRMNGIAPAFNYAANMAILMDSRNYQNLLPNRTGAVWQQVDYDDMNDPTITTNVSQFVHVAIDCSINYHTLVRLFSGSNSQMHPAIKQSKSVASL